MFFRHHAAKKVTFADHLAKARAAGFSVEEANGRTRISRANVATVVEKGDEDLPRFVVRAGIVLKGEIATLVDGGFQKFLETPSKFQKPAQAADLRAVHDFEEDLREALGITTLYNESLGTVSTRYLYDRVEDRDAGTAHHAWQVPMNRG